MFCTTTDKDYYTEPDEFIDLSNLGQRAGQHCSWSVWHGEAAELCVDYGRHPLRDVQIRVCQPPPPKSVSSRRHPGILTHNVTIMHFT